MKREEIIGKTMKVVDSNNQDIVGICGKVVDETRNTFKIKNDNIKTILKKGTTFRIDDETIEGDEIMMRPEERVKL